MARLTNLKPRLGSLSSRLKPTIKNEQQRSRNRDADQSWRAWYKTARWQRLRKVVLERDGYVCKQTKVLLIGKYPAPTSAVVDHILPHKGDPVLFWDINNLQSVSKEYHDSDKQRLERHGRIASARPKWLKPSAIPVSLICGPPASGKTHYVAENARDGDIIIDLDVIVSLASGQPFTHQWSRDRWLNAALWRRNEILGSLHRQRSPLCAWLIMSAPKAKDRSWWQDKLVNVNVIVLETSINQCRLNARKDADRDCDMTNLAAKQWWQRYTNGHNDKLIRSG